MPFSPVVSSYNLLKESRTEGCARKGRAGVARGVARQGLRGGGCAEGCTEGVGEGVVKLLDPEFDRFCTFPSFFKLPCFRERVVLFEVIGC